ncbi:MAG: tyrosine-type recombinase/integrase [Acidobacteria bacterium]|nr:tyrosine-type recombinase/integrase [Acidobacteriota bacterium]
MFRGVERSRARYLETDEIERLINAIDEPDFRDSVMGAIATGCRYQELARLCVKDVQLDAAAVQIRESKSGKPRSMFLNDEGLAFFETMTAGRRGAGRDARGAVR